MPFASVTLTSAVVVDTPSATTVGGVNEMKLRLVAEPAVCVSGIAAERGVELSVAVMVTTPDLVVL